MIYMATHFKPKKKNLMPQPNFLMQLTKLSSDFNLNLTLSQHFGGLKSQFLFAFPKI